MPYIKQEQRLKLNIYIQNLIAVIREQSLIEIVDGEGIEDNKVVASQLTYIVFKLLKTFYSNTNRYINNWYTMMDAEKVVNSAIDEFKRRFLHPYEDKAIERNGDVI